MNLARQSTTGPAEQSLLQTELAPSPDAPPLFPARVVASVLSVLFLRAAPLLPGPLLLGGGFLKGVHDLLADAHPGGSWWARAVVESTLTRDKSVCPWRAASAITPSSSTGEDAGVPPHPKAAVDRRPQAELAWHLPPLAAGAEPPDHPFELLPQPLGVRPVLAYRQERLDQRFGTSHAAGPAGGAWLVRAARPNLPLVPCDGRVGRMPVVRPSHGEVLTRDRALTRWSAKAPWRWRTRLRQRGWLRPGILRLGPCGWPATSSAV